MQTVKGYFAALLVFFAMGLGMPAWADPPAAAQGIDLTPLTNAVNFSSVLTGIMAIAATMITLYAGFAGVRWILRMVRSA